MDRGCPVAVANLICHAPSIPDNSFPTTGDVKKLSKKAICQIIDEKDSLVLFLIAHAGNRMQFPVNFYDVFPRTDVLARIRTISDHQQSWGYAEVPSLLVALTPFISHRHQACLDQRNTEPSL
jgi:hypothetical protein